MTRTAPIASVAFQGGHSARYDATTGTWAVRTYGKTSDGLSTHDAVAVLHPAVQFPGAGFIPTAQWVEDILTRKAAEFAPVAPSNVAPFFAQANVARGQGATVSDSDRWARVVDARTLEGGKGPHTVPDAWSGNPETDKVAAQDRWVRHTWQDRQGYTVVKDVWATMSSAHIDAMTARGYILLTRTNI